MSRNEALYNRLFNWSELPLEEVRPGVSRCAYATDEYMLVMNYVEPIMQRNPHSHPDFDQLACIISGRAIYHVDGVDHDMGPGSIVLIPAGAKHFITPVDGPVENLDIFCPPRSDYAHLLDYLGGDR